jgi:hypothetical protein
LQKRIILFLFSCSTQNFITQEAQLPLQQENTNFRLFVHRRSSYPEDDSLFARLISHQPAVLFSQNEPASSTLLSEQTSISHQPPANRTGSEPATKYKATLFALPVVEGLGPDDPVHEQKMSSNVVDKCLKVPG